VQIHQVIFGILFIVIVLALPGGITDLWAASAGGAAQGLKGWSGAATRSTTWPVRTMFVLVSNVLELAPGRGHAPDPAEGHNARATGLDVTVIEIDRMAMA